MKNLGFGQMDPALEVETEPLVRAARELDALGLDAQQKASLFGNVTALFAMKGRLSRQRYMRLCAALWDETALQLALISAAPDSPGGLSHVTPGGEA
jgi:hypothetical protein